MIVDTPGPHCLSRKSLCVVTSCHNNTRDVEGPLAAGSRCLLDYVGADAATQAAVLGVSEATLYRIEETALRKLKRRLLVLGDVAFEKAEGWR